jgi:hypothetical protein
MVFDYHYDATIRRFILQFIRIFSLIKIRTTPDDNNAVIEQTVPVYYGDMSRMVAHVLKQNSENTVIPSTVMSAYITNLERADNQRRNPYFVSKINIDERKFNRGTGEYTDELGHQYSIDRYMPSPYKLTMQLDIWTINTDTKLQILEQIMTIFNPGLQIQQHDNMLDWSIMTEITLENVAWTSRTIPEGTDTQRDIASLTFSMPIWINPPAKVRRKSLIEQIVVNLYEVNEIPEEDLDRRLLDPIRGCFDDLGQIIVTPGNHCVRIGIDGIAADKLQLLNYYEAPNEEFSWRGLIEQYGEYQEGLSYITLKLGDDVEDTDYDMMGTFEFDEDNSDLVTFNIDTDTLPDIISSGPITGIIDPTITYPSNGLPSSVAGQRYLITEDIPEYTGNNPWGQIDANKNDIIEYNGSFWYVAFNAGSEEGNQFVSISGNDSAHYMFDGSEWSHTYFRAYDPGFWRIALNEC